MHFLIQDKSQLLAALDKLKNNKIKKALVFVSDQTKNNFVNQYLELINTYQIEIYGGVFPSLIYDSKPYENGFILLGMPDIIAATILHLNLESKELDQEINSFKTSLKNTKTQTIFTLLSAFGTDKTIFLRNLYNNYGNTVNYFGAGCGSIREKSDIEIISNKGYTANAGLILALKSRLEINYAHGWKSSKKIYKVTEYEGNEIISIDWEPAFEFYKKIVYKESGLDVNKNNFVEISKQFPFGMLRLDSELIIRDPYAVTSRGGILVVDKIEEGEFIKIMFGNSEYLIKAAEKIAVNTSQHVLSFNCISRKLFHQNKINIELSSIAKTNLVGAFSIGEIVNNGNSYLEMYNKIVTTAKC
ncbi:FIST C-terminal domain-containing protein [Psychroflexus planctonicus]|uniref:FIST N domain-containing protein n=1 Tax=Psychroflexus planctonicus TaxID=1526575 RepID=A0ABQ1SE68_9FLAO|nr:FIST C-terminal domain-containing protein [Psychroflexus planctonicus]GGE26568.1 hypothetical protein GCM10010832_04080 [Psychroflexus planctonicus]